MPPTMPEPEAVDQTMFESVGSGVAQPLSPPHTARHIARGMPGSPPNPPCSRLLLGPR